MKLILLFTLLLLLCHANDKDLKEKMLEMSTAAAEHRPMATSSSGFFAKLTSMKAKLMSFFTQSDPLREKIVDEKGRFQFDRVRQAFLEKEMAKYEDDPVVKSIALGLNYELIALMKSGVQSVDKFRVYIELSTIIPNEFAEYHLIQELNPDRSHSPGLLKSLRQDDYREIMNELVKRHNRGSFFRQLYELHPLGRIGARFLRGILEEMSTTSGDIFVDYLHECHTLESNVRGFSVKALLDEWYHAVRHNKRKPHNVALGLLYFYVDSDYSGDAKRNYESLLKRYPVKDDEKRGDFLRGINSILTASNRLTEYAEGVKKLEARMNNLTKLVLSIDPKLTLIFREGLISILEMFHYVSQHAERRGRPRHDLAILESTCNTSFCELSVPLLSFALRTEQVPITMIKRCHGMILSSYRTTEQELIIKLMSILLKIEPLVDLCSSKVQFNISLGDVLPDELVSKMSYGDSQTIVYSILAYLFDRPARTFISDATLSNLSPIQHLNARLKAYCKDTPPGIIFHEEDHGKGRIWRTRRRRRVMKRKWRI